MCALFFSSTLQTKEEEERRAKGDISAIIYNPDLSVRHEPPTSSTVHPTHSSISSSAFGGSMGGSSGRGHSSQTTSSNSGRTGARTVQFFDISIILHDDNYNCKGSSVSLSRSVWRPTLEGQLQAHVQGRVFRTRPWEGLREGPFHALAGHFYNI